MILASFGVPAKALLADYEQAATDLNRVGERTRNAGIQLGYPNRCRSYFFTSGVTRKLLIST